MFIDICYTNQYNVKMNIKKNDIIKLNIESLSSDGAGVARVDGFVVFVKDALPSEVVNAKILKITKNFAHAKIESITIPSPERVEPECPHYKLCGGCNLMHMSYEGQLEFKKRIVEDSLLRIGDLNDIAVDGTLGMKDPFYYRNKMSLPVGKDKEGRVASGFFRSRSHEFVPIKNCCVGDESFNKVMDVVTAFMNTYNISPYDESGHIGCVRHIFLRKGSKTDDLLLVIVTRTKNFPRRDEFVSEITAACPEITGIVQNINDKRTNLILGEKYITFFGKSYITDILNGLKFNISPASFYQINKHQTDLLYNKVKQLCGLTGNETVFDLYCGTGTISIFLAQSAKEVIGIEIVPEAVNNAVENAELNGVKNATFLCGDVKEVAGRLYKRGKKADITVIDPPRSGSDEATLNAIIGMNPKKIIYVSCNPSTLARDLKYITKNGSYTVKTTAPIDMFAQTTHVETVVLLSKIKSTQHIEVEIALDEMDLTQSESEATMQK